MPEQPQQLSPEDAKRLEAKMDFAIGLTDETEIPETRFQVLHGRVYTLQRWGSGSSARGETTLDELERVLGFKVTKDGWYDHEGRYLANDPGLDAP